MCNNTVCRMTRMHLNRPSHWEYVLLRPEDEYDDNFQQHVGSFLTRNVESEENPYGMYPYLFAGTNPYQLGNVEQLVFQKDTLSKTLPNTTMEKVLLEIPFIYYVSLWLCLLFVTILIAPLMGMILFRFVALPLGELIGGKHTRKYLRHIVIMIEKSRRALIKWEWPEGHRLPPWRFRTPKLLRFPHEEDVPWELMEEKDVHRLDMQYPERWQIDERLREWKEKATKPECYADKWVFKMIHRKLLRDKKFHRAPHKFLWGESDTPTSSGTSTSDEDDNSKKSFSDFTIGTSTMNELSNIRIAESEMINRIPINSKMFEDKEKYRNDYKKRAKTVFEKRSYKDELLSHRVSKMAVVLDQNDTRWAKYSGELYDREKLFRNSKPKAHPDPWNLLKLSFGSRQEFLAAKSSWKPVRRNIKLRKKSIDVLTKKTGTASTNESDLHIHDGTRYDLHRLEKERQRREGNALPKSKRAKKSKKPHKPNTEKIVDDWKTMTPRPGKHKSVVFTNSPSREESFFTIKTIDESVEDMKKQLNLGQVKDQTNSISSIPDKKQSQVNILKNEDRVVTTDPDEPPPKRDKSLTKFKYVTVITTDSLFSLFQNKKYEEQAKKLKSVGFIDDDNTGKSKLNNAHRVVSSDSDEPPPKKRKSHEQDDNVPPENE